MTINVARDTGFQPVRGARRGARHGLKTRVTAALFSVALVTTVLLSSGARAALAQRPPNVVLIISDDQAWTDYSFMGHPHVHTPNLDRLASQSLTFKRG